MNKPCIVGILETLLMQVSLSSYIDLLEPWISPTLISSPYLSRIKKISAELPVLSFGCFECWLRAEEPRVDFNIAMNGKLNEHRAFCDGLALRTAPGNIPLPPEPNRLYSFFRFWQEKDFYLLPMIQFVWLVYDIPDPSRPAPVPWLYVHFRQTPLNKDPSVRTEIILQIYLLWEETESSCNSAYLRTFLISVTPSIQILSLGKPTSRQGHGLRLYLKIKTFDELTEFLLTKYWPGRVKDLQEKLHSLIPLADFFCLIIDLGDDFTIHPKIGIECWFDENRVQAQLGKFTQQLVNRGLCDQMKREEILKWSGTFEVETKPEFWSWPDSRRVDQDREPKKILIRRMIHYIKIMYEPDKELVAKAYLYFDRPINQ